MDKMMKECMQPHQLLHLLTGAGLGMVILALVPSLVSNALMVGVALVVVGVGAEFVVLKK